MHERTTRIYLASVSAVTLLFGFVGNLLLLLFSFERRVQGNKVQKFLIANLAIGNILTALIAVPSNLAYIFYRSSNNVTSSDIACLSRYLSTFACTSASFTFLAALCIHRRDQVTKVPYGKPPTIQLERIKTIIQCVWCVSFLPTFFIAVGYLYLMKKMNVSPCEPAGKLKSTAHYYVSICQAILVSIIFSTCITTIIRSGLKIKNVFRSHRRQLQRIGSELTRETQRRTNAIFYIALEFVILWIPFMLITLFSYSFSKENYSLAFTIGYEFAHASFALLPVVYALTDTNFRLFLRKGWKQRHSNRISFELTNYTTSLRS